MEHLKHFVTIFIPLLIIMDPFGNLPFFLLFTEQNSARERSRMAAISVAVACLILIFFGLTGEYVLRFFNIGIPAFQVAGGFIFFIYALQMLRLIPGGIKTSEEEEQEGVSKENVALVPLATPLLAGPGAITAVLVWQKHPETLAGSLLLIGAIVTSCGVIFLVFRFGQWILRVLGVGGTRVLTRLMGLLLAVIAVQFMVSGLDQILR